MASFPKSFKKGYDLPPANCRLILPVYPINMDVRIHTGVKHQPIRMYRRPFFGQAICILFRVLITVIVYGGEWPPGFRIRFEPGREIYKIRRRRIHFFLQKLMAVYISKIIYPTGSNGGFRIILLSNPGSLNLLFIVGLFLRHAKRPARFRPYSKRT